MQESRGWSCTVDFPDLLEPFVSTRDVVRLPNERSLVQSSPLRVSILQFKKSEILPANVAAETFALWQL